MKWIPRTVVVPKDRMDMNKPIHAYRIDSLTAAGLRNWFAEAFGISIAVFEILAGASFRELGFAAAKKYKDKDRDEDEDKENDEEKEKENDKEKEKEKENEKENGEDEMEEEEKEKEKTKAGEDSENRVRST